MTLSKTNTDALCCDTSPSIVRFVRLLVYRFNLWTGLYMLERHERFTFHVMVGICTVASFLYVGVFFSGFVDGLYGVPSSVV